MLDPLEIRKEIARLEYEEPTYPNCAKLADLYIIHDHMQATASTSEPVVTYAAPLEEPVEADSDFLRTVAAVPAQKAWELMDELIDTLRVTSPRVYKSIMSRLYNIQAGD